MMKQFFLMIPAWTIITLLIASCCSRHSQTTGNEPASGAGIPGPRAVIYLTRGDYDHMVPVTLSDDRMSLVSYPDPRDLMVNGNLCLPTRLAKGYLLDNRGIDSNVAFLNMTYETYSRLPKAPSPEEIMNMVLVKNPLKKMYVGEVKSTYSDIENQMNTIISEGKLKTLKRVK